MEVEGVDDHRQPAELHIHIGAARQLADVGAPGRENVAPLIGADPERPAEMVEHDLHLRRFARHFGQALDLRVVDPGFEGQIMRRQPLQAAAEIRVVHQVRRRHIRGGADDRGVVGRDLADAAEASARRRDLAFQHRIGIRQP